MDSQLRNAFSMFLKFCWLIAAFTFFVKKVLIKSVIFPACINVCNSFNNRISPACHSQKGSECDILCG